MITILFEIKLDIDNSWFHLHDEKDFENSGMIIKVQKNIVDDNNMIKNSISTL